MESDCGGGRLYHLALAGEWHEAVERGGPYRRSTIGRSLEQEGFVHCCFADQVGLIAERYYRGRDDVVVLVVDASRLSAEVKVESPDGGHERFPHVYGPLPLDAVVEVSSPPTGAP